jgi:hypothetical protein
MSIEPTNAFTVCIRAGKRPDEGRTLQDYLANIAARFPECVTRSGKPNLEALARRENRSMRHAMGISTMARRQWDKTGHSEEALAKIAAAANRRGEISTSRVVEALTQPMTLADISRASGLPETTAKKALERALDANRVIKRKLKSMTIWERRQEAAE